MKTLKKLTLPRFFAWFLPTHLYLQKPRFLNFRFKICKSVLFPKYGTCRSLCLSFVFVFVFGVAFCLQIREDINGKKTLSLGHCPNEGVGGIYPCPIFLALFQEVHFWSIKRVMTSPLVNKVKKLPKLRARGVGWFFGQCPK